MKWYAIRLTTQDVVRMEKAESPRKACKLAFGVVYTRGEAVYKVLPKHPRYFTAKQSLELQADVGVWHPLS